MPPDSTGFLQHLLDPSQWTIVNIAAVIGTIAGVIATVIAVKQWGRPQRILKELPEEFYTKEVIELDCRFDVRLVLIQIGNRKIGSRSCDKGKPKALIRNDALAVRPEGGSRFGVDRVAIRITDGFALRRVRRGLTGDDDGHVVGW